MGSTALLSHAVRATAALLAIGVLTGCGGSVQGYAAVAAAQQFTTDASHDPAAACRSLAPKSLERLESSGSDCASEMRRLNLPSAGAVESVVVAGHSAQVRYARDTVFLALFDYGWRVTAAGCRRTSSDDAVPYDCDIEAG